MINLDNTDPSLPWNRHRKVYPARDNPYIANGEIGMAIGTSSGGRDFRIFAGSSRSSSRRNPVSSMTFTNRDFREEGNLAWNSPTR